MSGLVLLVALVALLWLMMASTSRGRRAPEQPPRRPLLPAEHAAGVDAVLEGAIGTEQQGIQVYRGRLRLAAADAYERLRDTAPPGMVPLLQEGEDGEIAVILAPAEIVHGKAAAPTRHWLHWLLLGLTFMMTTWAGAAYHGGSGAGLSGTLQAGLPYSVALMLILGIHELGHFFAARAHRIDVTLPYFIPVPFALGTFGAFIRIRSRPSSRKALFDMAVAGPLAGLAVAVPALLIGLRSSAMVPPGSETLGGTSVGSSIVFAALARLSLGTELGAGHLVRLGPLAFAGWLGLLVTALNLLPIGQLDGGHIARALFGHRAGQALGTVAMWSVLLLALFVWPGLLLWAVLVFFLAGRGVPPLEDVTALAGSRRWLGLATLVLLVLLLLPLPHALWQGAGIHCPYL